MLELLETLTKLENEISPSQFHDGLINYWPLLRFQMNYFRKNGAFNYKTIYGVPSPTPSDTIRDKLIEPFIWDDTVNIVDLLSKSEFGTPFSQVTGLPQYSDNVSSTDKPSMESVPQADVAVLCMEPEHWFALDGKPFAPILDGIISQLPSGVSYQKFTFGAKGNPQDWHFPALNAQIQPFVKEQFKDPLRAPVNRTTQLRALGILQNCKLVENLLSKYSSELRINSEELLYRIDVIIAQSNGLSEILKQMNSRVLFLTSYSGRLAAVYAARKLGIPVVDIQHGGMGSFNPFCTHWSNVPKNGYEVLPDWFWCWTEEIADLINATAPGPHNAICGGNPAYLPYVQKGSTTDAVMTLKRHKLHGTAGGEQLGKKTILVALQYGKDKLIDDHVLELFRETKDNWTWLFRLHPLGIDRKSELISRLGNAVGVKAIDDISRVSLSLLLPYCDYLVTKYSNIVREAVLFGVRPILTDSMGGEIHRDLISKGVANIATDKQALETALSLSPLNTPNAIMAENQNIMNTTLGRFL